MEGAWSDRGGVARMGGRGLNGKWSKGAWLVSRGRGMREGGVVIKQGACPGVCPGGCEGGWALTESNVAATLTTPTPMVATAGCPTPAPSKMAVE